MELRQLRYFIKVAETLSFSEAAKALFVTQSTLSQQIKQLEHDLDTLLLERSSHGVTLTEAGRELLPCARRVVDDAMLCRQRLDDLKQIVSGTLNIGVTYSFSPILTETLVAFMKLHSGVKLNVCYKPMAELMEMLRRREVDFVLAFRPTAPVPDVVSHVLFQNTLSVIVPPEHRLYDHSRVTLEELSACELALPSRGLQARNALDAIVGRYNLHLDVRVELNEVNILLKLIRQCHLATVLADATIEDVQGVRAIPLDVPESEMEGCVHSLRDTYHKHAMTEFLKMLNDSLAVRARVSGWF